MEKRPAARQAFFFRAGFPPIGASNYPLQMPVSTYLTFSEQLARLEQEVGVRLLNRNTRSMSLTGAGRMLYEQA